VDQHRLDSRKFLSGGVNNSEAGRHTWVNPDDQIFFAHTLTLSCPAFQSAPNTLTNAAL
jgi:hypothetical protein